MKEKKKYRLTCSIYMAREKYFRQIFFGATSSAFFNSGGSFSPPTVSSDFKLRLLDRASLPALLSLSLICLLIVPRSTLCSLFSALCSTQEGEEFAKENGLLFLEASAKSGEQIDDTFIVTARMVLNNIKNGVFNLDDEAHGIKVGMKQKSSNSQKSGCC